MINRKHVLVSFDIKFIRFDQKHVGLARQASPISMLFLVLHHKLDIKLDTNMVFSMCLTTP